MSNPFTNRVTAVRSTIRGLALLWGLVTPGLAQQFTAPSTPPLILESPDGQLRAEVLITPAFELAYSLHHDSDQILGESPLGITVDGEDLGTNVALVEASAAMEKETDYARQGVSPEATDHHNRYLLTVSRGGPGDGEVRIETRVFDDGFAYRYFIPGNTIRTISGERSGWNLLPGSRVWFQPDTTDYTGIYDDALIGSVDTDAGGPLTVTLPGATGYLLISEAALFDYPGLSFDLDAGGTTLVRSEFLDDPDWPKQGGFASPWRVVAHAEDLNELVTTSLFTDLCPKPKALSLPGGADSPWIKPGRILGGDETTGGQPPTFESILGLIDQAHQLGFEYVLVGSGWEESLPFEDEDKWARLLRLTLYGRAEGRNVGLWVTSDWTGLDDVETRGDLLFRTRAVGAVGVKFINVGSESQADLETYRDALYEAGIFQLMVNFESGSKATGEARTFPHELTRGGVRGSSATIAGDPPVSPRHNTILPFTRFVPGPGDYAPVVFDPALLGTTTLAHQLATAGVFTSPLTHWPDQPGNYLAQTDALDLIYEFPTTWDETLLLPPSEIGELVVMARRKGDRWYLFLLNGDDTNPVTLPALSLGFLGDRTYDAILLGDQDQTTLARSEHLAFSAATTLPITLLPGGGFVGMFVARPEQTPPDLDSDGDGIPDVDDCAPLDPTCSSPHTFYADVDRDHYGSRFNPVQVCSSVPQPPLVAWNNDPNDFTMLSYPEIIPKGDRMLGLDSLQTNAAGSFAPELLAELGVEVAPLRLTWGRFESTAGAFDGPDAVLLATAAQSYLDAGLKIALVVSAYAEGQAELPADLQARVVADTLDLNDAEVVTRFSAWLDHLATQLGPDQLHSLQIGESLEQIHGQHPDPAFWTARQATFSALKTHAESLWGSALPVLAGASHASLLTPPTDTLFADQMALGDVVGIGFQPRLESFDIIEPEYLQNDLQAVIDRYPGRDFHLLDVAYPSLPAVFSSETKQSQSLRALFDLWDFHVDRIPFVSFQQLFDPPLAADTSKRTRYFGSLGLRTHDGEAKAAYKTLRNLAFERGWWRIPAPTTRSYRMGFTQTQFDQPDDLAEEQVILDWMLPNLTANSDLTAIQIDMGVPWVEALADDLAPGTPPPYNFAVLDEWGVLLNSVPQNQPRVIAISPIGNPRSQIAAYWGEGQGYRFEEGGFSGPEFVRVPDGPVEPNRLRYPPPPWDTIALNSPEVKEAYLKYCIRVIEFFQPDYLLTCLEASAALVEDEQRYDELVELMEFIYTSLKANPRYADLPQVISISTTSFITDEYGVPYKFDEQIEDVFDKQVEGLSRILPYMDIIGLSNYPHFGKYNAYTLNASMYDSLFENIARAGGAGKPVAISENGYSADPYQIVERPFLASPEKQDDYYKNLLYSLAKTDHPVEYVVNWSIRDNDILWQRKYDEALAENDETALLFSEFNQFFRDIGLYDGDGGDGRPALARWQSVLALPIVPKALLEQHPSYMEWVTTHFPEVAEIPDLDPSRPWSFLADPDGDGRLNIFEYVHHSDPHFPDPPSPLRLTSTGTGRFLELPLNFRATGVTTEIRYTPDLQGGWQELEAPVEIVSGPDADGNAVLRIPLPGELPDEAYFRLEAQVVE